MLEGVLPVRGGPLSEPGVERRRGGLAGAAGLLACPLCGRALALAAHALHCSAGHSFDIARQGYVTLLAPGGRPGGDSRAMVEARADFLDEGHFAPLTAALCEAAERALADGPAGCLVDVGAGPGHQLARLLERLPDRVGLALDLSRPAARRAARAHPRLAAVVCDVWRGLPLRSAAAALVLDVLAPRNGRELRRVLHERGTLLVVTARRGHLAELVAPLALLSVDARKPERLERTLGAELERVEATGLEFELELSHASVERLVKMGPSARHTDPVALRRRIAALPEPVRVTASFELSIHRPRRRSRPARRGGAA